MRALTPFLKTSLHAVLTAPLQDVLDTRERDGANYGMMGPHIVLVSRVDPQTNAVLVNDGTHSMWAFLPPTSVQACHRMYPHIRAMKDFRGCVLRVEVCHFSTTGRVSTAFQSTTSLGRICLHITCMEIIDVPSISPNESPHVLNDPSVASLVDMPLARLEPRLLPHSIASPITSHHQQHPTNTFNHAYMFHEQHPLTLEDCIIPSDQWRQLEGLVMDMTDSQLIAQNGSVPIPPSSQSQPPAAALPHSTASDPSSITMLPSTASPTHDIITDQAVVEASNLPTTGPTQASSAPSPARPYAFCHQSLPDNFIVDPDSSSASSSSPTPRLTSTPARLPRNATPVPSSIDKENSPHASAGTPMTTSSGHSTSSGFKKQPLGNATNLIPSPNQVEDEPHDALTRKSPIRTAALRRRTKSTASMSSSSSTSNRSQFSSRYDWDDETKDDAPDFRGPHEIASNKRVRNQSTSSAMVPAPAAVTGFSQWQTQPPTQPVVHPSQRSAKRPRWTSYDRKANDQELMAVLDDPQHNNSSSTDDDDQNQHHVTREPDFFRAVHFRPSIRRGVLYSIQMATPDCTTAVLEFIQGARRGSR
ncbi:hypothetical protein H257_08543 [Aphanomyces astaci]|uniref:Uncharacterized protein n=1 Tax=Aphanomyces astaci TaxID=112090 RepID=W4GFB6_APHAT|nr:hypothetical protein H257_08543 [Aphanomyces astaci]ETV77643.1 hypothetical protein H257_08543 [Aphanomyces astaci]|eukprot:XP_009832753.1 hypothetical protein H257_08543 [Aphanomyces astaci]